MSCFLERNVRHCFNTSENCMFVFFLICMNMIIIYMFPFDYEPCKRNSVWFVLKIKFLVRSHSSQFEDRIYLVICTLGQILPRKHTLNPSSHCTLGKFTHFRRHIGKKGYNQNYPWAPIRFSWNISHKSLVWYISNKSPWQTSLPSKPPLIHT